MFASSARVDEKSHFPRCYRQTNRMKIANIYQAVETDGKIFYGKLFSRKKFSLGRRNRKNIPMKIFF
jgi:hypothetical protein